MQHHDTSSDRRISIDFVDGAPLAPDDPRVGFARATQLARAVVARIDDHNAASPTPCDDWDVAELGRHVLAVFERVAIAPTGADVSGPALHPDVGVAGLTAAIASAAHEVQLNWSDPATLEQVIETPWGPTPGAGCLGAWASELLVHSWDLATALDLDVDWPEPDTSIAADMARAAIPAEMRGVMPFGEVVDVPDDAPAIERLVAWVGRNPRR